MLVLDQLFLVKYMTLSLHITNILSIYYNIRTISILILMTNSTKMKDGCSPRAWNWVEPAVHNSTFPEGCTHYCCKCILHHAASQKRCTHYCCALHVLQNSTLLKGWTDILSVKTVGHASHISLKSLGSGLSLVILWWCYWCYWIWGFQFYISIYVMMLR